MSHLYMTDYGPVRVSDSEAAILQLDDEATRSRLLLQNERVERRINALKAACNQVARWKVEQ